MRPLLNRHGGSARCIERVLRRARRPLSVFPKKLEAVRTVIRLSVRYFGRRRSDRRYEAAALIALRFDVDGFFRVIAERHPNLTETSPDALAVGHESVRPKSGLDLLVGNELTGFFEKMREQLSRLGIEFYRLAVFAEFSTEVVKFENSK